MSAEEVLKVKARFNGCFIESLLESSFFKGITNILRVQTKSTIKERCVLLSRECDLNEVISRSDLNTFNFFELKCHQKV